MPQHLGLERYSASQTSLAESHHCHVAYVWTPRRGTFHFQILVMPTRKNLSKSGFCRLARPPPPWSSLASRLPHRQVSPAPFANRFYCNSAFYDDAFRIDWRNEKKGRIASCNEKVSRPPLPHIPVPAPLWRGFFVRG